MIDNYIIICSSIGVNIYVFSMEFTNHMKLVMSILLNKLSSFLNFDHL